MQSFMPPIPLPLFAPSKSTRSSPRTSPGGTRRTSTPRIQKSPPKSTGRQSSAKRWEKMADLLATLPKDDEDNSDAMGDSVQLEQDEVASASTPRITVRSLCVTHGGNNGSDSARPTLRSGRISEILNWADIGAEQPEQPKESKESKGSKKPEEPQEPEELEEEMKKYKFKRFVGHRWVGNSIEIQVEWAKDEEPQNGEDSEQAAEPEDDTESEGGVLTWEPETLLHEDAPEKLFEYWHKQGGRPENPRDPGTYEVFAILKHNMNRTKLLIEWVGYKRSEASWESRDTIDQGLVDEYFAGLKTKSEKKGGTKKLAK